MKNQVLSPPSEAGESAHVLEYNGAGTEKVDEHEFENVSNVSRHSPFRTPPSLPYCQDKVIIIME